MIRTRLTDLLGLTHPIISAPMAKMIGGVLAGAVSKAGALGTFGGVLPSAGGIAPDYIADCIAKVRATTARPFGIGFLSPFVEADRAPFDFALAEDVPVILLAFGDPRPWLRAIKARGRLAICQVQNIEAARGAVGEGADVLAVQGSEAPGGIAASAPCCRSWPRRSTCSRRFRWSRREGSPTGAPSPRFWPAGPMAPGSAPGSVPCTRRPRPRPPSVRRSCAATAPTPSATRSTTPSRARRWGAGDGRKASP
jgi:hypothetical protein